MLSILIPTYNYDCSALVRDLHAQVEACEISFEILVAEDGSERFLFENQTIEDLSCCRHIVLKNNIGRAGIRNFLANEAKFENLLFIDSDAKVKNSDFIKKYISHIGNYNIIWGGIAYESNLYKNPEFALRLKYGQKHEANPQKANFTTFNFLVKRSIFTNIKFNEAITSYGHEDLVFRHELRLQNILLQKIDNPLTHCGLDNNKIYLNKIKQSCKNLFFIYKSNQYPLLYQDSKLLSLYLKLEKYHLTTIVAQLFSMFERLITKNLTSGNPNLTLFNCYKIGYLCHFAAKQ